MKITSNNVTSVYNDIQFPAKDYSRTSGVSGNAAQFDAITIQSGKRQLEEHSFRETISKKIAEDVCTEVSDERLEQLKAQLQNGSYQVDPMAVAARMLLVKEG